MWEQNKLGEVFEFKNGRSFKKTEWCEDGLPIIRIQNLNDDNALFNYFKGDYDPAIEVNRGDLLFSWSGTVGSSFGAYIWNRERGVLNQHIFKLTKKKEVDTRYAFYCLKNITTLIEQSVVGSVGLRHVTKNNLIKFEIPIPPLPEQQRIVAKLDAAFTKIDEASEKITKARDPIAQLYINFLRNELRDSSYDWHTVELGNIAENLDSARVPITKSNRTQGSIPYYGASGIVDYVDGYLFNEDLLLISEDGANLLMRTYPIAFSVSGKTWVNNHAHVLKFADKEIEYWVEQYLNITNLSEFITGMAQPKLNQKKLNSIPIPIPSKKKRLRVLIETIKVLKMRADCLNDAFIKKEAQLLKLKSAILFHELQSKEAA